MTNHSKDWNLPAHPERQILIACDDDRVARQLEAIFRAASFTSKRAKSISAACQYAKSGRSRVIFTVPSMGDGSWRRLVELRTQYNLELAVVLIARSFDFNEWGESMEGGAFDVLDALQELPKAAELAREAFSAALLKNPKRDSTQAWASEPS